VLNDERAAALDVFEQASLILTQRRSRVVCAHARDDGVEAREVFAREVFVGQKRHVVADLTERFGYLVARTHHIADAASAPLQVNANEFGLGGGEEGLPTDVRVVKLLHPAREAFAAPLELRPERGRV